MVKEPLYRDWFCDPRFDIVDKLAKIWVDREDVLIQNGLNRMILQCQFSVCVLPYFSVLMF